MDSLGLGHVRHPHITHGSYGLAYHVGNILSFPNDLPLTTKQQRRPLCKAGTAEGIPCGRPAGIRGILPCDLDRPFDV